MSRKSLYVFRVQTVHIGKRVRKLLTEMAEIVHVLLWAVDWSRLLLNVHMEFGSGNNSDEQTCEVYLVAWEERDMEALASAFGAG